MKSTTSILLAVGSLAVSASGAHAVTIGLAATETGYVDGRHVYIDPLTVNGQDWFCLSPDLDIALGSQPYVFTPTSLTPGSSSALTGYALTSGQIGEIGALIGKGLGDIAAHASGSEIAADASAIWEIEGATVTPDDPTLGSLIQADYAWAQGRSGGFEVLTNSSGVQNLGGVPEAATWVLMILGFGAVGAMKRRSRPSLQQA